MSSELTLCSPQELSDAGFHILADPTLLTDPLYTEYRKVIDWFIAGTDLVKRPPYDYQRRYAAMAACRRRNLLAHEQGLGKTYETICLIGARYGAALFGMTPKPLRRGAIQIVAPEHTLNLAWLEEFKVAGLDAFVDVIHTETDILNSQAPIWLLGYDLLKRQTARGRQLKRNGAIRPSGVEKTEELWRLIRRVAKPHFAVFDEIHMLREDSDRTAAVVHYVRGVKNRTGLTGTPVDGWVAHLATILKVIYGENNSIFPWETKQFTKLFTRERIIELDYVTGEAGGAAPKKRRAPGINPDQIPEFHDATKKLMHRLIYRDPEVSGQVKFPPVNYHIDRCPLLPHHGDFYYDLHETVVTEIARSVAALKANPLNALKLQRNVLTQIQMLRQAASCPWAVTGVGNVQWNHGHDIGKVHRAMDLCLKAKAEGRKVIIFTNFIGTGRVLTQVLNQLGIKTLRVYASDKLDKPVHLDQEGREARIEKFLGDPDVNVLMGNLGLLSTGLTMVQASVVINYDHDWRANTYKQGISRVVRPGGRMAGVDIHDFLTDQTVDLYVFHSLMNKVKATAEMIDRQFELESTLPSESSLLDMDPMDLANALISGDITSMFADMTQHHLQGGSP